MSFQADKAIYKPLNNIRVTDKKDVASEDISTKFPARFTSAFIPSKSFKVEEIFF